MEQTKGVSSAILRFSIKRDTDGVDLLENRKIEGQVLTELALNRGRRNISWTICRIPVWPFDYIVKAGQPARPKD